MSTTAPAPTAVLTTPHRYEKWWGGTLAKRFCTPGTRTTRSGSATRRTVPSIKSSSKRKASTGRKAEGAGNASSVVGRMFGGWRC